MSVAPGELNRPNPENNGTLKGPERERAILLRPYEDRDCGQVVALARRNFQTSFVLFPKDVKDAYVAANRDPDVRHATKIDGTEAYVAETTDGQLGGFCLIRYNPVPRRNAYGELDLRRLHVSPTIQGQGIGKQLLGLVEQRARQIKVEFVITHASGSSRPFFEQNGWTGQTVLNEMTKRGTSALVFVARKGMTPEQLELYQPPTHLIYAGSNGGRLEFLKSSAQSIDEEVPVFGLSAEEEPSEDVVRAAQSKAYFVASRLKLKGERPLIVASDSRTEFLVINPGHQRYALKNTGKPESIEAVLENFRLMLSASRETKRPVPYIVRSATYLHSPAEPGKDTYHEYDVSIWLSREALETLSTPEGLQRYRNEVSGGYGVDITKMSGGFALPVFLERGYVEGINGYPLSTLPHKEEIVQKALHTALVGVDEKAIRRRFGILS